MSAEAVPLATPAETCLKNGAGAVLLQHSATFAQHTLSQASALSTMARIVSDELDNDAGITGFEAILLACLSLGGVLHAVGMAVRKHTGSGHSTWESLAQWQWWAGALCDAIGGILIWPAMPYISVNLVVPWVVVVQLGGTYALGCLYFKEPASAWSHTGLALAVIGVVGLSVTNPLHATGFSMDSFWDHWAQTPFVLASGISVITIAGAYFLAHRSTFWALAAAFVEAVQFICSRALVDTAVTGKLSQSGTIGATVTKCLCIVAILLFQHWGLQSDLSRFSGIFLAAATFLTSTLGTIYFSDAVVMSRAFVMSAMAAIIGIWLLNRSLPRKLHELSAELSAGH